MLAAKTLPTSVCIRAKSAGEGLGIASSSAPIRRARQSPNQSRPRNTGKSGGAMRSLALTRRPLVGETEWGNADPDAQPIQSNDPSPVTGADPSPARRMGMRPVVNWPIVVRSATSMFCTGDATIGAAAPASATVRARFNARRPVAAVSPGCRFAIDTASTMPAAPVMSLITGPCRLSRTVRISSGWPRTRMRSSLAVKASVEDSIKMSCTSASVVVKVHAMFRLCPSTRNGTPGAVAPASVSSGVSMRARYQMPGKPKARCGSPARIGAPVALCAPSTAHSFDADSGCVQGPGKRGRTAAKRVAAAVVPGSGVRSACARGGSPRHSSSIMFRGSRPCNDRRCISARQLPDKYIPIVLAQSRLSEGCQGSGAPKGRNSSAANRPRSAIQAFTPFA